MGRPASAEDIDMICRSLPEVELGISWGDRPTYKVPTGPKGRGFVLYRAPNKFATDPETDEMCDDLLVISVADEAAKMALVDVEELTEIITEAWLDRAPKALAKEFLANG